MNRRGFLGGILAACAAPAIVRADSLMRIVPRDVAVITSPAEWLTAAQVYLQRSEFERLWREIADRLVNPLMLVRPDGGYVVLPEPHLQELFLAEEMLKGLTPPERPWFTLR